MIPRAVRLAWLCVILAAWLPSSATAAPPDTVDVCTTPGVGESKALARACEASIEREAAEGDAPADRRLRAIEGLARLKANTPRRPATQRWVSIGPTPIVGGRPEYTLFTRPRSGRVAAIAIDPSDHQHWLIGAAGGGVWQSRDGGTTWAPRTDDQSGMAMGAIAFAPSDPRIVYAGTGERVFSAETYGGVGVLKSLDGGRTWTRMAESSTQFTGNAFSVLVVHPTNSDVVMAAVTATPRRPQLPPRGIFKTLNGGRSWEKVLEGEGASALVVDPRDFKQQYGALGYIYKRSANGVYRSLNEGQRWDAVIGPWSTSTAGAVGRVELALSPSNPNVLYVSIQDADVNFGGLLGLWKTENAWTDVPTWQPIPVGEIDGGAGKFGYCGWHPGVTVGKRNQCWYNHELSVDPTDPYVLYAGGVALWKYARGHWHELAFSPGNRGIHADQHRMTWVGKRLVVGNDGGLWSTTNGGASWDEHNTGLSTILFWGGAIAPTPGLLILGGTQDNGTAVLTGTGGQWTGLVRGDAGPAAISSTRPDTHWAIEGLSEGLQVWRTVDGGRTLKQAGEALPPEVRRSGVIAHPIAQCPANHDVLLLGDKALWKTTNFFASTPDQPAWVKNNDVPDPVPGALAFASSDASCGTYALASKGILRLTTDGGVSSWRDLDPGRRLPKRDPKGLVFDPRTANTLFVVFVGYADAQGGHVFRTGDALAASPTWQDVSQGPEFDFNFPHNSIALDPVDPNIVWVGTDLGVWRGQWDDASRQMSWIHHGPEMGLPNVTVLGIRVHAASRQPIAFTHGRGAYLLTDLATWCGGNYLPTLGSNFGGCPR